MIDTTGEIVSAMPALMATVNDWKQRELPRPVQEVFAQAAHVLRDMPNVEPTQLLEHRRTQDAPAEDGSRSLWHTMNVIEENLMTGGLTGQTPKGRKTKTRPIKSVSEDIRTNRALWLLTTKLAEAIN